MWFGVRVQGLLGWLGGLSMGRIGVGLWGENNVSPGFVRGVVGHEVLRVFSIGLVYFALVGGA